MSYTPSMEAEVQRVIRSWFRLHELRENTKKWPLSWFDYAFTRIEQDVMPGNRDFAAENLLILRNELTARIENERLLAEMASLQSELVQTQRKIETTNEKLDAANLRLESGNEVRENAARDSREHQDRQGGWRVTDEKVAERRYQISAWWTLVSAIGGGVITKFVDWLTR